MWNPFSKKKNVEVINKKSYGFPREWIINGSTGSNNQITIKRALRFYDEAAPVATAIDWINDEFKTLNLVIKTDGEIETQAEILTFLKNPNDDMTRQDFMEYLGAYFLIANEVYIIATGNVTRKPAELLIVSPEFINVKKDADGFAGQIEVQRTGMGKEIFKRADNSYRFYNKDMSAEIWQIKGFSAMGDGMYSQSGVSSNEIHSTRGRSKLNSISREINQYIEIANHNLAVLNNGMLPSGTLTVPDNDALDDAQFQRVKEMVDNYYAGAKNGGKVLVLDNGMTFTPMGLNPKDADFKELTKQTTITVFNRYKVPLPLISAENMTLANMDTAKLNLYDNCVIPLAERLLTELTNFLGPRFGLAENQVIAADMDSITALQIRRNEEMKLKKDLGIFTTNQLLAMMGADGIGTAGDVLYIPSNLVPIGSTPVQPAGNNSMVDVTPPGKPNPQDAPMKSLADMTTRPKFIEAMKKQVDKKGNQILSDKEINEIADSEGL